MMPSSDERGGRAAVVARAPAAPPPIVMSTRLWPAAAGARVATFLLLVGLPVAWLWRPLDTVITVSLRYGQYEHYSHIVLIPVVCAALVYLDRGAIFGRVAYAAGLGGSLMLAGVALSWWAHRGPVTDTQQIY